MLQGIEAVHDFRSRDEWRSWVDSHRYMVGPAVREYCVEWIRSHGIIDPYDGSRVMASEITISEDNLRESIKARGINSRGRAIFAAIKDLCNHDRRFDKRNVRIYTPEALSEFALRMRQRHPYFLGSEYLPTDREKRRFYPVQHQDLHDLKIEDESFELVVANDVFEHVPDLHRVLGEIARILVPYGRLIATFPFRVKCQETKVCAVLEEPGNIRHIEAPEYHGNPVDPKGSLVFQVPGWDVLDTVRAAGFEDACMTFYCSMRFGILASGINGVLVLNAKKALDENEKPLNRRWHIRNTAVRAVAGLIGLPRSGTTVLTACMGAHSKIHTVYEPWNASKENKDVPVELGLDEFLSRFSIKTGDRDLLWVKETCTRPSYVKSMDYLLDSVPGQFEKHFLWIMRNPFHVYLSEIEARTKWWGLNATVGRESFEKWSYKSLRSMRKLLHLVRKHEGRIVFYDTLVNAPATSLKEIMDKLGLPFESGQLNYHATLNKGLVAGDVNVASNPQPVADVSARAREQELNRIDDAIRETRYYSTIASISEWCEHAGESTTLAWDHEALDGLEQLVHQGMEASGTGNRMTG